MKVITTSQMKEVEERAHTIGFSKTLMMENAGRATADEICKMVEPVGETKVVVLCGTGNNGGDGASAARHLALRGYNVYVFLLGRPEKVRTEEARTMWEVLKHVEGVEVEVLEEWGDEKKEKVVEADVVLDAMLGTGVKGEVREPISTAIDLANRCRGLVVAVDLPSGLNPDTGEVGGKAVKADLTVTFHAAKPGLVKRNDLVGKLVVAEIGIPFRG